MTFLPYEGTKCSCCHCCAQFPCSVWKFCHSHPQFLFHSTKYQHTEEGSGDLGPLHYECNCWMSIQKACNLLHMPQSPSDSVLATCNDSHYTPSEFCIADSWMTEAMWSHRDCTDLMLTQSTASAYRW